MVDYFTRHFPSGNLPIMDGSQGTPARERDTDATSVAEELTEFEFTPLAPAEETELPEKILIMGAVACR